MWYKSDLDLINNIILSMVFFTLKRALHGGERNFLKTTTSEILNQRQGFAPEKKEGFFSKFRV